MVTPVNNTLMPQNATSGDKTIGKVAFIEAKQSKSTTNKCCMKMRTICPPQGSFAFMITDAVLALIIFGLCWGVTGEMCLPGGKLYALLVIFSASYLFGLLATKICLPDLFGMIVSGVVLRNVPLVRLEESLDQGWSIILRSSALIIILVRAGLGLDPGALKHNKFAVLRLAFSPCLMELCCVGVVSHFLIGLPWTYAFMLGSVLAAVSPAVVVPGMLKLKSQGYGIDKGIPTLVIAASSVDDILAILAFGMFIGIKFGKGNIVYAALKTPMEIVVGAAFGIGFGYLLWFLPHAEHEKKLLHRFVMLLVSALAGLFISRRAGLDCTGPFAALTMGFMVELRWKNEIYLNENEKESVARNFEITWNIFKTFLFGLIGAEVSFSKLDLNVIGIGLATLLIGLVCRMATTFLVVCGNKFNIKEKIFIMLAWIPKATVQAAIGGIALDMARKRKGSEEEITWGLKIVSIAAFSILITAPLGALLLTYLGPRLLTKSTPDEFNKDEPTTVSPRLKHIL